MILKLHLTALIIFKHKRFYRVLAYLNSYLHFVHNAQQLGWVKANNDNQLPCLGFASRSQSFAKVATQQQAHSVRYPDSVELVVTIPNKLYLSPSVRKFAAQNHQTNCHFTFCILMTVLGGRDFLIARADSPKHSSFWTVGSRLIISISKQSKRSFDGQSKCMLLPSPLSRRARELHP